MRVAREADKERQGGEAPPQRERSEEGSLVSFGRRAVSVTAMVEGRCGGGRLAVCGGRPAVGDGCGGGGWWPACGG